MDPALKQLIEKRRYPGATSADALGLVIASALEWDGAAILEAAHSALEDANFHTEAGKVAGMRRALGADNGHI